MQTKPKSFHAVLNGLRAAGLTVAVHNDCRVNGQASTFWLMTDKDMHAYKGEGATDREALLQIAVAWARQTLGVDDGAVKKLQDLIARNLERAQLVRQQNLAHFDAMNILVHERDEARAALAKYDPVETLAYVDTLRAEAESWLAWGNKAAGSACCTASELQTYLANQLAAPAELTREIESLQARLAETLAASRAEGEQHTREIQRLEESLAIERGKTPIDMTAPLTERLRLVRALEILGWPVGQEPELWAAEERRARSESESGLACRLRNIMSTCFDGSRSGGLAFQIEDMEESIPKFTSEWKANHRRWLELCSCLGFGRVAEVDAIAAEALELKRIRNIVDVDARKRHGDREGEPSWGVIADCVRPRLAAQAGQGDPGRA